MNKCEFIGRLTKDPELTTTTSGISITKFNIAVDRKFKKEDGTKETDFFNCVAWRGLADNINKYVHKGSKVYVFGEIQNHSYDDKDGIKRYVTDLQVSDCEFLDNKLSPEEKSNIQQVDDDNLPF